MNILIIDSEKTTIDIIDFMLQKLITAKINTFHAYSGHEAAQLLLNQNIDLCISEYKLENGTGDLVYKHIKSKGIKAKFVLCSSEKPENLEGRFEGIYFSILKPNISEGLTALVAKLFDSKKKQIANTLDDKYIAIPLKLLVVLGSIPTDIYVKISPIKYLKCISENEHFSMIDHDKWIKNGVKNLYVQREFNVHSVFSPLNESLDELMKNKQVSSAEKLVKSHERLLGLVKFTGITQEVCETIVSNIKKSMGMIKDIRLVDDLWINLASKGDYLSNAYVLQFMLSSVLVEKMGWFSESTILKLSLAAFLQDVTLYTEKAINLYDYTHFKSLEHEFSPNEIENYMEHPINTKALLDNIKKIPADVDRLILEHHEQPRGDGFPRGLNSLQISPLTAVFILSGLLAKTILNEDKNFNLSNFLTRAQEQGYNSGNYKAVFKIIENMK